MIKIKNQKFVSPILMWAIVVFGIFVAYLSFGGINKGLIIFTSRDIFPELHFLDALFYLSVINWLYFFSSSIKIHHQAANSVQSITKIITGGIYSRVRHPIYFADILLSWGVFFYFSNFLILLCVIWLNIILYFWMNLEEKYLIHRFGEEYKNYQSEVPMFIPNIFKESLIFI